MLGVMISSRSTKLHLSCPRFTREWDQRNDITENTKRCVYQASSPSCETWTTYTRQEKILNSFHLRCLRRIFGKFGQDMVTNSNVLERASSTSMYTLLSQRRLRWLGHVHRMANGRTPQDVLYGEPFTGTPLADHIYITKTPASVTWRWQELTLITGRPGS